MADSSIEKLPPQNLEAEMAVLGSMLLDENAIGVAVEVLERNSFYHNTHKEIFEAIVDLYSRLIICCANFAHCNY